MPRVKTFYSCQQCGYQSVKWLGKCPDCGEWNAFVEERTLEERRPTINYTVNPAQEPKPIKDITCLPEDRLLTGISEFDRVLGGGIVSGSVILIGGDPGIGKSTLLLQAVDRLSHRVGRVLYISGEESQRQIRLRAERLGAESSDILILTETSLEEIQRHLKEANPMLVVVDSIQTIFTSNLQSAPGSISQVKEVATQFMYYAKRNSVPVFIIGHVTKDGAIAGPRVLEHLVDTVLYFEGDGGHSYRILRAVKNRFGSTNEIGVFEMKDSGLIEINNPSEFFLSERAREVTGSVVVSSIEGTRPILAELQALVTPTYLGIPRRTAIGVDYNRVSLLLAILEKRGGIHLSGQDVFVNVTGGIRIDEPAIDLGLLAAVASSFREIPIDHSTIIIGEVGLSGEIRGVNQAEVRIKEAAKLGFKRCLLPANNSRKTQKIKGMEILGAESLREALKILFP